MGIVVQPVIELKLRLWSDVVSTAAATTVQLIAVGDR